ncbi:hypothetical protein SESBI_11242 [Sesbania bispinosa]|nr:hypothetical protein SESBI_11242 [Sesbania bispinosa]
MAENNSFEETFGELNAFQELPNTNERIHEATDTGLVESSKEVVAKHFLSLFNQVAALMKTMLKRQEQMEQTLQILLKKGVYNNEKPNEDKGLQINDSTHISGENHAGNNGTTNGPMHIDWDNIKLEPFQQDANDVYFVDEDSGVDLKVIASNFRRGHNLSAPNNTQESQVEDKSTLIMPRKLSFSPPGTFKKQKLATWNQQKSALLRRTPASKNVITAAQQNKNVAKTYIKTKFKPL